VKKAVFILLVFTLFFACSCKDNTSDVIHSDSVFYSFTDDVGKEIVLSKKPEKVAVLFSSYADIWKLSGGEIYITVGESIERGFAADGTILADSGSGHTSVNTEVLISCEADFIIGTADYACQSEACSFTDKKGIPSALFRIESFEDYLRVLKIFCDINDTPDNFKKYGEQVKNDIDSLLGSIDSADCNPKILFIRAGSSARSVKAKNSEENFVCRMLSRLGTQNIADASPSLLDGLSLENIILDSPDYIFISLMGDENASREYITSLFEESGWKNIECIKNKNYTFLPKELFHYKPNAKWADAYKYLIKILYPENEID